MTSEVLNIAPEVRPMEELLAELDFWTGRTKIELVDEAVERRDEIVPHLLAHLETVVAEASRRKNR